MSQQSIKIKDESRHLIIKEEVRKLQRVGGYDMHGQKIRASIISFPKSYVEEFGLKTGDIFVYSLYKRRPLTFTLKKLVLTEDMT